MSKFKYAAILILITSPMFAFASQSSGTGGDSSSYLRSQSSGTGGDSASYLESQSSGTGGDYVNDDASLASQSSGTGGESGGILSTAWSYSQQVYRQQMNNFHCLTSWNCMFNIEE